REVPVLVLQHNRHFLRVTSVQPLRQIDPRIARIEGNVKVMIAGQAAARNFAQCGTHDTPQRLLRQEIVPHQVFRHVPPGSDSPASYMAGEGKCRLLLPGACEPRLSRQRPRALISVYRAALSSESNRSIVVVCNYILVR